MSRIESPICIARRELLLSTALGCVGLRAFAQDALVAERPLLKVGDRWKYEQRDRRTQAKEREFVRIVTAVTATAIEYTEDGVKAVMTPELTVLDAPTYSAETQTNFYAFPLQVGKTWTHAEKGRSKTSSTQWTQKFEAKVAAAERVQVPAGSFDTLRVECAGLSAYTTAGGGGSNAIRIVAWYAPAARSAVKIELDNRDTRWVRELVELQLVA